MAIYKATVELFVDVDSEPEACDAISELLSCDLQVYIGPQSCFIDWRHVNCAPPVAATESEIASLEHAPL